MSTTCAEDDPVPTPKNYLGWDRSAVVAWGAIEQYGGIVPDIEEDRSHAPPAWWRYPSALRSAALLADEARSKTGLYEAVAPAAVKQGDILVRTQGAGVCGKMAILGGQVNGQWMTLEADGEGTATRAGNPLFFQEGKTLRPEVKAYRIRVKKDETLGHVRELRRDLDHLERTIAERPPLVAKNGRAAVDEKIHDLIDEAWSLVADAAFDLERRELTGRAWALAAALDWPGAPVVAAAVLDDVLRRNALRAEAVSSRAMVMLLSGQADKAIMLAEAATAIPEAPPRLQYVLGRSLLAGGKTGAGLAALKRYMDSDPIDPRARRLVATGGAEPKLAPAPPADAASTLQFTGSLDRAGVESVSYDFRVQWPLTWRVLASSVTPETGVLLNLTTGRVLLDDGDAQRGAAVILIQRPENAAERAALVKKAGRNMFPQAKLRTLPPVIRGSRRELFRERREGGRHEGEVTTIQRGEIVYFLVLNAPAEVYPKLKEEYYTLLKSFEFLSAKVEPAPPSQK
jgi:hypothetical protein